MYRRPGRGRLFLLVFLALSIVVITLDFRQSPGGPLARARDLAVAVVAPVQRGFTTVTRPIGDFFSSLGDISSLREDNARMKEELQNVRQEVAEARSIEGENVRLREELELDESWATMDKVGAEVYATASSNYKWSVSITKGHADGVRADMAVITSNGPGLVGKVSRVTGPHTSDVLLLVDPDAAVGVRIAGVDDVGILRGNGENQNLTVELVDTERKVKEGAVVRTSGYDGGIYPPDIPVGEVVEVGRADAAVERHIEVIPSVDFKTLDFVQVLLESGPRLPDDRKPARAAGR
jgi:rod shape-determining protein MreC